MATVWLCYPHVQKVMDEVDPSPRVRLAAWAVGARRHVPGGSFVISNDLIRSLAMTTPSKIVLLVMDGVGGLPDPLSGRTELE